jgi:hypothetical protein
MPQKRLFQIAAAVLLVAALAFIFASPVFAWPKDGGISCERVFAKIKNTTHRKLDYTGFVKANGEKVASVSGKVSRGEWALVEWDPPDDFSGSIEAKIIIIGKDSHRVYKDNLVCAPPTATPTETNTATPTETNTATETSTSTQTSTPIDTPTFTPTNTATQTSTPTETNTPIDTPTGTLEPTDTPTNTPIPTNTPKKKTATPTKTPVGKRTPTRTPPPPPKTGGGGLGGDAGLGELGVALLTTTITSFAILVVVLRRKLAA